jgi:hypothetical protein
MAPYCAIETAFVRLGKIEAVARPFHSIHAINRLPIYGTPLSRKHALWNTLFLFF